MNLRAATTEDQAFLQAVYASTRAEELALTGWDAATCAAFVQQQYRAQTVHYTTHFPQALQQVIVEQGEDVGRLWTDSRSDELHVLDLSLLPAARCRGLGTRCLQDLRAQAHARGLPLGIYVEIHNPARRLYERLGFIVCGEPQGLYLQMLCPPPAALQAA